MRDKALTGALIRRTTARGGLVAAAAAAVVAGAAIIAPASAFASAVPVSIASAWAYSVPATGTNVQYIDTIGATEDITYTVKSASGTVSGLDFTDTLPAGLTVDPSAPSADTVSGCGTLASPGVGGSTTITVSGATVVSGTSCAITVPVDVASSAAGTDNPDAFSAISYTAGGTGGTAATETPAKLEVVPAPTFSWGSKFAHKPKFKYGQLVPLEYNFLPFTAATPASATAPFSDQNAGTQVLDGDTNELAIGQDIDTLEPTSDASDGSSLTFDGSTAGGWTGSFTQNYTVEGPVLTSVKGSASGVKFKEALPLAGTVKAELLDGKKIIGKVTKAVKRKSTATVTVKLNAAGKRLVSAHKSLKVSVSSTFTPKAGVVAKWPNAAQVELQQDGSDSYSAPRVTAKAKAKV